MPCIAMDILWYLGEMGQGADGTELKPAISATEHALQHPDEVAIRRGCSYVAESINKLLRDIHDFLQSAHEENWLEMNGLLANMFLDMHKYHCVILMSRIGLSDGMME